ncbi:MAG TPA: MIP family channel protein [Gemmatimonadales bacterium]|nr:MIP family channel protein [Gemmatimonadales bacterium]
MNGPRLGAEAIGTFMLVFIGAGAVTVDAWNPGSVGPVGIALSFGFAILAGVYALGHVSGAHFNPAVTVGLWLSHSFPGRAVLPYVLAQLVGAVSAALVLRSILGGVVRSMATVPHIGALAALSVETILTFFLVLVVAAVATDGRVAGSVAGLAVGLTIAFDALMGGPLTGASMNPARSFGPALVSGTWTEHWVYWVGPLAGSVMAAKAYLYLRKGKAHESPARS